MTPNQSLVDLTTKLPSHLQKLYEEVGPDLILVQRRYYVRLYPSLIAFYNHIPMVMLRQVYDHSINSTFRKKSIEN